jgi:hypothetical protein
MYHETILFSTFLQDLSYLPIITTELLILHRTNANVSEKIKGPKMAKLS